MRKINEQIWHCTATPEGREVSIEQVRRWHTDKPKWVQRDGKRVNIGGRGWSDVGYHRLVHLDGSVSIGRPISKVGAHVEGRNVGTIGDCYVGGLDAQGKPKDTRTPAQKATMRRLTIEAIDKYGVTMVSGHHDYAAKACPCFPARAEYAPLLRRVTRDGMPEKDPASDMTELKESRTVKGGAVGLISGGALTTDSAMEMKTALESADSSLSAGTVVGLVAGLLVIGVCVYTLYVRWDDAGRPIPWARKRGAA